MAVTNAYATVADLRLWLGDSAETLDVSLLERAINASSRAIDKHCNRRFWADSVVTTREYVVDDCFHMYVDDISTSSGVIIKTDDGLTGAYAITWTTDDYRLNSFTDGLSPTNSSGTPYAFTSISAVGSRSFPKDWWRGERPTLQVTAKFGWSEVPDEVEEACLLKAALLFRRKDAPFGVAGFDGFGPVRITRNDPDVIDMLSPYKIHLWA